MSYISLVSHPDTNPAPQCLTLVNSCREKHLKWKNQAVNKQLLDEVEHDIMNYQNRGLCYLPKPKAEADNTDTRF